MDQGHTKEASGILVYLTEELGDARLRCTQLKQLVTRAVELVEKSEKRDHFYEMAGDVIYGIPDLLFRLDKALDAASLAASKLDYEEIKQGLRPEKVDELEEAMKDVRLRYVNRRSEKDLPMKPKQAADVIDRIANEYEVTGNLPAASLSRLVAVLEGQDRVGSQATGVGQLRAVAEALRGATSADRLQVAQTLRGILAEHLDVEVEPKAVTASLDVEAAAVGRDDEVKIERAIETTEEQLRELKHAWKVYQGDPGKNAPQLENLVAAARTIVKTLQRFILDRVKVASEDKEAKKWVPAGRLSALLGALAGR